MKRFLILATVLLVMLQGAVFAEQGAVIGYYRTDGNGDYPTVAEIDKATHIIVFQIYPNEDGSDLVLDWLVDGNKLTNFVKMAQYNGKKVMIAIGGAGGVTPNFPTATNSSARRANFISKVKALVEKYKFDGVDLDWEPENKSGAAIWQQWIDLALELKVAMPDKRISGTLGHDTPNSHVGNHITKDATVLNYIKENIWKLDAVQIMTYDADVGAEYDGVKWNSPADPEASIKVIQNWAKFGNGQDGFSKEKIFIGIKPGVDNAASAERKASYARDNGFGGSIFWEIKSGNAANTALLTTVRNASGEYVGTPIPSGYKITVNIVGAAGGTVKNGNTTVNSGEKISVEEGEDVELTFEPKSGYSISDVKIDGESDSDAKTNKKFSFNDVDENHTINITFTKDGEDPKPDGLDLADGSWGEDAWSEISDEGKNGSNAEITKQGNPLTANWKLGEEPDWETAGDDDAPYAGIGFYTDENADWSAVTEIVIEYSINEDAYIALSLPNDDSYMVKLDKGQNKEHTFTIDDFEWDPFDWDKGTAPELNLSKVNGIAISALNSYDKPTNLTVTSLIVKGLVIEKGNDDPDPITFSKPTAISKAMSVGITNRTLNLSLPTTARNAQVMLFDVRGRMLMQQQINLNTGMASVALPKNIVKNQALIVQIKTTGVNLTKRILVK